jgi:hypothetical protein
MPTWVLVALLVAALVAFGLVAGTILYLNRWVLGHPPDPRGVEPVEPVRTPSRTMVIRNNATGVEGRLELGIDFRAGDYIVVGDETFTVLRRAS